MTNTPPVLLLTSDTLMEAAEAYGPEVFKQLAVRYAQSAEIHIARLVRLLAEQGIHCSCSDDEPTADANCPIHQVETPLICPACGRSCAPGSRRCECGKGWFVPEGVS